jgi:hypothetical protein
MLGERDKMNEKSKSMLVRLISWYVGLLFIVAGMLGMVALFMVWSGHAKTDHKLLLSLILPFLSIISVIFGVLSIRTFPKFFSRR